MVTRTPYMSRLVVGLWRLTDWGFSAQELTYWVKWCLAQGITSFDHADIYGDYRCEMLFGEILALAPELRPQMEIITKCGIALTSANRPDHWVKHYNTSKGHIIGSVEQSLKNFHTDYLDILLIHRPDPLMNADEVAAAFVSLREAGKVRNFGVSNFTNAQFELLQSRLDFPLVTNQIECSVCHLPPLHDGTLDYLQQKRVIPMAWSPLGGGSLFTRHDPKAARIREAVSKVAEAHEIDTVDTIVIAWLLAHPAQIVPVVGTRHTNRIDHAIRAEGIHLDRQEWFSIWEASAGEEVP